MPAHRQGLQEMVTDASYEQSKRLFVNVLNSLLVDLQCPACLHSQLNFNNVIFGGSEYPQCYCGSKRGAYFCCCQMHLGGDRLFYAAVKQDILTKTQICGVLAYLKEVVSVHGFDTIKDLVMVHGRTRVPAEIGEILTQLRGAEPEQPLSKKRKGRSSDVEVVVKRGRKKGA